MPNHFSCFLHPSLTIVIYVCRYAQCADRLDVTSSSCKDLLICVNEGTTFESRLKTLFPARFIVPRQSGESAVEGLTTGDCNALAGGVVDVSLTLIRNAGFLGEYQTGSGRYSKDPLAVVTRQDDAQWSKFVFWIVTTIFGAEEKGISQATADQLPTVGLFGPLFFNAFQNAIGAVGNYAEIYERNAEADVPRGGLNTVNVLLSGPQHYPLPGVI
jgi:general L-amino acid transport system substrate-binding protein